MSEFKEGDKVLVHGVVINIEDQEPSIRVEFSGFGSSWVREAATVPVLVEPQPVDPSTLRVGDRVRSERVNDTGVKVTHEGIVTSTGDGVITLNDSWVAYRKDDSRTWFLLDRPEPVDPRREAVKKAVEKLRLTPYTMTDDERADTILAAIDGVTK